MREATTRDTPNANTNLPHKGTRWKPIKGGPESAIDITLQKHVTLARGRVRGKGDSWMGDYENAQGVKGSGEGLDEKMWVEDRYN